MICFYCKHQTLYYRQDDWLRQIVCITIHPQLFSFPRRSIIYPDLMQLCIGKQWYSGKKKGGGRWYILRNKIFVHIFWHTHIGNVFLFINTWYCCAFLKFQKKFLIISAFFFFLGTWRKFYMADDPRVWSYFSFFRAGDMT